MKQRVLATFVDAEAHVEGESLPPTLRYSNFLSNLSPSFDLPRCAFLLSFFSKREIVLRKLAVF